MKDNNDKIIRDKINSLDTIPTDISFDKEVVWQKIVQQKAQAKNAGLLKSAGLGIAGILLITGLVYYYTQEHSKSISNKIQKLEYKRVIENSPEQFTIVKLNTEKHFTVATKKLKKTIKIYNPKSLTIFMVDTIKEPASVAVPDSSRSSISKLDTISTQENKVKAIPYSGINDEKFEKDFRYGKVSTMQMILGSDGEAKFKAKERKDKKRKR